MTKKWNKVSFLIPKLPTVDVLIKSIVEMDQNVLTEDLLNGIVGIVPTKDEIELIKKANESRGTLELEKPEAYLLGLSELTLISERIEPWIFLLEYGHVNEGIEEPLSILEGTVRQLKKVLL